MWTPKRVVLLAVGFFAFLSAYFVYSQFLGGIDGLPPLPPDYRETKGAPPHFERNDTTTDTKLAKAFGVDCDEKNRNIKLELESKHMVLAAGEMTITDDGRVKLCPFSLAIFGKDKGDPPYPEINTLQSKVAYLRFDEKVKNIVEMSGRKIVAAELRDDIYVINNRHTEKRDDDLSLFTQGPLHFDDSQHMIFTERGVPVRMTDPSNKPNPNTITGLDLHIKLKPPDKAPPVKGAREKSKDAMNTDVERIALGRDVDMYLWVDAQSGFLGTSKTEANQPKKGGKAKPIAPAAAAPPAEKAKVVIMTQGPFEFDPSSNVATFEIAKTAGARANVVTVDRLGQEGKQDHLQSDRLEIHFHRKSGTAEPSSGSEQAEGLDIENARATGRDVMLTSDAELLEAHGDNFFYDKVKQVSILKGSPRMWAIKEGNEIEAPELELHQQKGAEEAIAIGAGRIRMLDKKTGKRPVEARWKERLNYLKEGQQDILTLRGDAIFIDDEHKQQLSADTLKVWLLPVEGTPPPKNAQPRKPDEKGSEETQRKPKKLDALGHVAATGPDMNVHDTDHLIVHFKDVPPSEGQLPPAATTEPATKADTQTNSGPKVPPPAGTKPAPAAEPAKKKPIDLSARIANAFVRRTGEKNDLDELWCEGAVHVQQDPATPADRGVDIRGETLKLNHFVDGNILVVTGDHAQVQINKICILGPAVNIDQTSNEVWVTGMGIMRMLSERNFDGKALDKPTELIVSWDNRMFFDGLAAKFRGNVQGQQDTGHLAAPWMDVTLDHRISLKEGEKSGPPAKVQKLVCGDDHVWMEDVKQEGKRIVSAKRIDCQQMSVDNDQVDEETQMEAPGPGVVRIFQQGDNQDLSANTPQGKAPAKPVARVKPAAKNAANDAEQFKLTRVTFDGKMVANNKRGTATFYDRVTMLNFPTEDPDFKISEARLPPGSVYLTCSKLEVLSHKINATQSTKEMRAYRDVQIEGTEFSGHADFVKYDESKEQIILEGSPGNLAVLKREIVKGHEPDVIEASKIYYWRRTGMHKEEGAKNLDIHK